MFLIKTRLGPSAIHGNGVFAGEAVTAGQTIWRFHPPFDQVFSEDQVNELPPAAKAFVDAYAYRSLQLGNKLVLSGDNARFLNHSDDPNTEERPFASAARRSIAIDEEITCDYDAFCLDGIDFAGSSASASYTSAGHTPTGHADIKRSVERTPAPHENLFTRLQGCADGIGVFAIRDIPQGTPLFEGDVGETTRIPGDQIDRIEDAEIRRMYLDFCPVVDGAFLSPKDFNQLTMGWYLNHADDPNVTADKDLQFVARRFIARGEELRTDYTAFSEHAAMFVQSWRSGRSRTQA